MDYQLWFYIAMIFLTIDTTIDNDAPEVLRILSGTILLWWIFRLIYYLVEGV